LQSEALDKLRPQALFSLKDKVAIVTGAGGGLGAWLSAGAHLLVTDHPRSPTAETAKTIRQLGVAVHQHTRIG